jgi:hypothetical protein
VNAK